MVTRWILAIAVCLASLCISVRAEEIQLVDGTKITGKVTGVSGDTFQVKTDYGDIQVPRTKILSIKFLENAAKTDADSKPLPVFDESLDGRKYTNRTEGFQLTLPDGWVLSSDLRNQNADIAAAFRSPDQIFFLFITPEKFSGTLETYEVLAETQLKMNFKDYERISQSGVKIDGVDGVRLVWHAKNAAAHDAEIRSLVYILPYQNRMVRIMFSTIEPLFDSGVPAFEKIAASFQATQPQSK